MRYYVRLTENNKWAVEDVYSGNMWVFSYPSEVSDFLVDQKKKREDAAKADESLNTSFLNPEAVKRGPPDEPPF